jgi:hypothetical protein
VQGVPEEGAGPGVFGPLGSALSSVDGPRNAIPSVLVAAATLALLLLGLGAAMFPVARAGAVLLHLRGSNVLAGAAALAIAFAVFVLLSLL